MRRGTIGFSTCNMIVSRIIRWVSGGKFSHCFIVLDSTPDPNVGDYKILEASWSGVTITSIAKYRKGYEVELASLDKVESSKIDLAITACELMLGQPYGYGQMLAMIPAVIAKRLGYKWKNAVVDGIVCSELVSKYIGFIMNNTFFLKKEDEVTPEDIYEYVKGMPGVTWEELK
jgi:hypothetical protein